MAIIAGIDEAGLGPVVGPLVASAAIFRVSDEQAQACLWKLLRPAVCAKPSRKGTRLAIGDSKGIYKPGRPDGLVNLERGVLAMLGCLDVRPAALPELLGRLCPHLADQTDQYPWYRPLSVSLPQQAGGDDVALSSNAVRRAMDKSGAQLLDVVSEVCLEGHFNRLLESTGNKSVAAFTLVGRLIARCWSAGREGEAVYLYVDRQGGRTHYRRELSLVLDSPALKILEETDTCSAYHVQAGSREGWVRFLVKGETHQLPVALASMTSKYVRELMMLRFNDWWQSQVPGLAPTAGYAKDGRRFLRDVGPHLTRLGVPESMLARTR